MSMQELPSGALAQVSAQHAESADLQGCTLIAAQLSRLSFPDWS